jgi:hypothetical protein
VTRRAGITAAAFLLLGFGACAFAQAGKTSAHSTLRIQVQVVPTGSTPTPVSNTEGKAAVTYNVPIKPERMSVTEELQVVWMEGKSGQRERCLVKTITMVPK